MATSTRRECLRGPPLSLSLSLSISLSLSLFSLLSSRIVSILEKKREGKRRKIKNPEYEQKMGFRKALTLSLSTVFMIMNTLLKSASSDLLLHERSVGQGERKAPRTRLEEEEEGKNGREGEIRD